MRELDSQEYGRLIRKSPNEYLEEFLTQHASPSAEQSSILTSCRLSRVPLEQVRRELKELQRMKNDVRKPKDFRSNWLIINVEAL